MKLLIILFLILNSMTIVYSSIPRVNPCIKAKNTNTFRRFNLSSTDMEACFQSAIKLVEDEKTVNQGVELFSKFLYVNDGDYRRGAMLQLGNTKSPRAIEPLLRKGKQSIRNNDGEDLEIIVVALLTLNAHSASRELASYAKSRRKGRMMHTIGNEYLVYTNNNNFERMEKIVGPIFD